MDRDAIAEIPQAVRKDSESRQFNKFRPNQAPHEEASHAGSERQGSHLRGDTRHRRWHWREHRRLFGGDTVLLKPLTYPDLKNLVQ